jgi:hypothetical protein
MSVTGTFLDQRIGGEIAEPAPAPEALEPRHGARQPFAADGTQRHETGDRPAAPGNRNFLAALDLFQKPRKVRPGLECSDRLHGTPFARLQQEP